MIVSIENFPFHRDTLRLALRLVNLLNESLTELNRTLDDIEEAYGTIYIPDSDCVLRAASELCYNEPECQWVRGVALYHSYNVILGIFILHGTGSGNGTRNGIRINGFYYVTQKCSHRSETRTGTRTHCFLL